MNLAKVTRTQTLPFKTTFARLQHQKLIKIKGSIDQEDMLLFQKKVCLLGDFAVGKTSLIRRYVEGRFDDKYLSSIGVKISRKLIEREKYALNLIIWDLAGGRDFEDYEANYLRGASAALLVCDLTRPDSLNLLARYAGQMKKVNPHSQLLVAANKNDLKEERVVRMDELKRLCDEIGCGYFLTSAKTGENVEASMAGIADLLMKGVEIGPG